MQKDEIRERLVELIGDAPVWKHGSWDEAVLFVANHLIAHGVTVQEWIPVSERLPEKDMDVLLYDTQSATTFLGEFCSKTTLFDAHWFVDNETWDISEFTHWMPLPKPPKEVAEWHETCPYIEDECTMKGCLRCVREWLQQPWEVDE